MLRRTIGSSHWRANAPRDRTDGNDVSTPCSDHAGQLQLGEPNRRNKIHIDKISIHFRLGVLGKTTLTDAGIVDQNVNGPTRPYRINHRGQLFIVSCLKGDYQGLPRKR